jgi:hypothetical protein
MRKERRDLRWTRLAIALGLVGAFAAGCSNGEVLSEKGNGRGDGGVSSEGGRPQGNGDDAAAQDDGGDTGDDAETPVGTTGQACASNSDCTSADGDQCSVNYPSIAAGVSGSALPRPVCMQSPLQDNCDPTSASDPSGALPHFCDGPDDPSSPGICLADNPSDPVAGEGTCFPKCAFSLDGGAASGCTSPDTCTFWAFGPVGNTIAGFGFCQGTCQTNGDCSTSQLGASAVCQTDVGVCTTQPVTRTLSLGEACTYDDYQSGACNCDLDPGTLTGFCTTACVVGGAACPSGWVCDANLPSLIQTGATTAISITVQNPGLAGLCMPVCPASEVVEGAPVAVDAGADDAETASGDGEAPALDAATAAADASSPPPADAGSSPDAGSTFQCPAGSTCGTGTVVGPECIP